MLCSYNVQFELLNFYIKNRYDYVIDHLRFGFNPK